MKIEITTADLLTCMAAYEKLFKTIGTHFVKDGATESATIQTIYEEINEAYKECNAARKLLADKTEKATDAIAQATNQASPFSACHPRPSSDRPNLSISQPEDQKAVDTSSTVEVQGTDTDV